MRKEGQWNVFKIRADGSGQIEQLTYSTDTRYIPSSWSLDDVLAIERGPEGQRDILVLASQCWTQDKVWPICLQSQTGPASRRLEFKFDMKIHFR